MADPGSEAVEYRVRLTLTATVNGLSSWGLDELKEILVGETRLHGDVEHIEIEEVKP